MSSVNRNSANVSSEKRTKKVQKRVAQSCDLTGTRTRATSFKDYRYTAGTQNQTPVLRKGEMPDSITQNNSIYNPEEILNIRLDKDKAKHTSGTNECRRLHPTALRALQTQIIDEECTCIHDVAGIKHDTGTMCDALHDQCKQKMCKKKVKKNCTFWESNQPSAGYCTVYKTARPLYRNIPQEVVRNCSIQVQEAHQTCNILRTKLDKARNIKK